LQISLFDQPSYIEVFCAEKQDHKAT
jgi:hypothetical protein